MDEQVKPKSMNWCVLPSDKTPGNQRDIRPLMLLPLFGWRKGKIPLRNNGWTFDVWLLCLERSNGMRVSWRNVPAAEFNCSNSSLWCNIRLGFLLIALLIQARVLKKHFLHWNCLAVKFTPFALIYHRNSHIWLSHQSRFQVVRQCGYFTANWNCIKNKLMTNQKAIRLSYHICVYITFQIY